MLRRDMSLKQMIDFKPHQEDLAMMPLDVYVYTKVSIVSLYKEDNYNFIIHLFNSELVKDALKDVNNTIIYDFDGTQTDKERFVTIFELYSLKEFDETADLFKQILEDYSHEAEVIFDLYTYDNEAYRLSNLDALIKLEKLNY